MSIVDVAIWAAGVAALFALVYVHRRAVVPAAPAPTTPAKTPAPAAPVSSVDADLAAGEQAIEAYFAQFEADAKAWLDRTAQVTAVKAKVAAVKVPVAATPVAHPAPVVAIGPAGTVAVAAGTGSAPVASAASPNAAVQFAA